MVGGVKGKADKCGKGGEGVQNPGNFADVLYEWSPSPKIKSASMTGCEGGVWLYIALMSGQSYFVYTERN